MLVSFPNLDFSVTVNRVAFNLFGIDIYWYAILIATGLVLGLFYIYHFAPYHNLNKNDVLDVATYTIIGGIVGARLYYVIFAFDKFKDNLWSIFNLRDGGIAIYGAIIGGFLVILFMSHRKHMNLISCMDLSVIPLFIGQCIGRWGNFFNQEAFGTNTNSLFAMYSENTHKYLKRHSAELLQNGIVVDPNLPVHPTFLYESFWCLIGLIFLLFYRNKRKFTGEMSIFYAVWYGLGRFFIEGLRTDSLMILNFRASQLLSLFGVVIAICLWVYLRFFKKIGEYKNG